MLTRLAQLVISAVTFAQMASSADSNQDKKYQVNHVESMEEASELMQEFEFVVINFADKSKESDKFLDIYRDAKTIFDEKIGSGEWTPRSVAWVECDIVDHPEMRYSIEHDNNQMVMGVRKASGTTKVLNFKSKEDAQEGENAQMFANYVALFTGDHINPIKCEDIQQEKRRFYDEFVYFGPKEDLLDDGKYNFITDVAIVDKFSFDEQMTGFWYNEDPQCRIDRELDGDKSYLVGFNGFNSVPHIIEEGQEQLNFQHLLRWNTVNVVKGTPRWSQRAHSAIFDFKTDAIVYMMPELSTPEELNEDWRIQLMARTTEFLQTIVSGFVPVVATHTTPGQRMVPELSQLLNLKKEDLPNLFMVHPLSDSVIPYPDPLDDPRNFSP